MEPKHALAAAWPEINSTVSIVALALAAAIFLFSLFSGARANKVRILVAVVVASVIGFCVMPLALRAASGLTFLNADRVVVATVAVMMLIVALVATCIYEIITVTLSDIGQSSRGR